jgi:hypothetical protein
MYRSRVCVLARASARADEERKAIFFGPIRVEPVRCAAVAHTNTTPGHPELCMYVQGDAHSGQEAGLDTQGITMPTVSLMLAY